MFRHLQVLRTLDPRDLCFQVCLVRAIEALSRMARSAYSRSACATSKQAAAIAVVQTQSGSTLPATEAKLSLSSKHSAYCGHQALWKHSSVVSTTFSCLHFGKTCDLEHYRSIWYADLQVFATDDDTAKSASQLFKLQVNAWGCIVVHVVLPSTWL